MQRRRGDYGSVGVVVVLIRTGKLDWEVCCFRSADDGYDAMPSTSANAITAGTTGTSSRSVCSPGCCSRRVEQELWMPANKPVQTAMHQSNRMENITQQDIKKMVALWVLKTPPRVGLRTWDARSSFS